MCTNRYKMGLLLYGCKGAVAACIASISIGYWFDIQKYWPWWICRLDREMHIECILIWHVETAATPHLAALSFCLFSSKIREIKFKSRERYKRKSRTEERTNDDDCLQERNAILTDVWALWHCAMVTKHSYKHARKHGFVKLRPFSRIHVCAKYWMVTQKACARGEGVGRGRGFRNKNERAQ